MSTAGSFVLLAVLIWISAGVFWVKLSSLNRLATVYPDRSEAALARIYTGYGQLGPMNTAFEILSGCRSGFRIELSRLSIPSGKAAFIPWIEIALGKV